MSHKGSYTLSFDEVVTILDYCPTSGLFSWKFRQGNGRSIKIFNARFAGKPAGCVCPRGYVYIRVRGHGIFGAHRLAHLIMSGEWPEHEIDHANGNPSDNRWSNLRPATRSENGANRMVQKNSKTGVKGVFPSKHGKFAAQVSMNRTVYKLGDFDTVEQARLARDAASAEVHGVFRR